MRADQLIGLMHDALLRIERDVAGLAEAVQEREASSYYGLFTGGAQLTDHAIEVRARVELIVSAITPLALEHIETTAKNERERGQAHH